MFLLLTKLNFAPARLPTQQSTPPTIRQQRQANDVSRDHCRSSLTVALSGYMLWIYLLAFSTPLHGQLRIVTYNTATTGQGTFPNLPRDGMDLVLHAIGNELRAGIVRPIDVLALQEQEFSSTSVAAFVSLLNDIYGPGTYARSQIDGATLGGGRVGLVYNTQTVQLINSVPIGNVSVNGASRQPMRYQLRPVGYTADADFYVYVHHYNATNPDRRQVEAQMTRANADGLGPDARFIYAGDFNIRTPAEAMYQTLLAPGNGKGVDPLNINVPWHASNALRFTHTQSPYNPSFNDPNLIAGGMDDRYDFQLISQALLDTSGFSYILGSYRAFGNNGTHPLFGFINDPANSAQPINVLNALASVSDHLPVVVDYRVPAIMQLTVSPIPPRVIRDAVVPIEVQVKNVANVTVPQGAAELNFSVEGTGGLMGSASGTVQALTEPTPYIFQMNTSAAGQTASNVIATTTNPQVPQATITQPTVFTVLNPAKPSFSFFEQVTSLELDLGLQIPSGGTQGIGLQLHNLLQTAVSSRLDLDQIVASGDTDALSLTLQPFSSLFAGTSVDFNLQIDTSQSGLFTATWDLLLSDEDVPGETQHAMSIAATGAIALPGDANLDGVVDGSDFIIWNQNKFQSNATWSMGDFNLDGVVDGADFILWNQFKFQSLAQDAVVVPEPCSSFWLLLGICAVLVPKVRNSDF